jgi:hypothetical protein
MPHLLKLLADPNDVPSGHPVLLLLSDLIRVATARDSVKAQFTLDAPPSRTLRPSHL